MSYSCCLVTTFIKVPWLRPKKVKTSNQTRYVNTIIILSYQQAQLLKPLLLLCCQLERSSSKICQKYYANQEALMALRKVHSHTTIDNTIENVFWCHRASTAAALIAAMMTALLVQECHSPLHLTAAQLWSLSTLRMLFATAIVINIFWTSSDEGTGVS